MRPAHSLRDELLWLIAEGTNPHRDRPLAARPVAPRTVAG
ncbi:hypothetical protein [Pseudomonas sp. NPDC089758]